MMRETCTQNRWPASVDGFQIGTYGPGTRSEGLGPPLPGKPLGGRLLLLGAQALDDIGGQILLGLVSKQRLDRGLGHVLLRGGRQLLGQVPDDLGGQVLLGRGRERLNGGLAPPCARRASAPRPGSGSTLWYPCQAGSDSQEAQEPTSLHFGELVYRRTLEHLV
jgi:hypothetical protein